MTAGSLFDVSDEGTATLRAARATLFAARERRIHPARDEKILACWNGLTLAALAEAAGALGSDGYLEAATKAGDFVVAAFVHDGDRLFHSWRDGRPSGNGFLEDYACVVEGLLALYQATFAERHFIVARRLVDAAITHFRRAAGGFFDSSSDHESLIIRPRSVQDSPTPSGNSMMATVLLKMAALTGESHYWELAEGTLDSTLGLLPRAPMMFGQWLQANLLLQAGTAEAAIVGDLNSPAAGALLKVLRGTFRPHLVVGAREAGAPSPVPMLRNREPRPEAVVQAWVCRNFTCSEPTADPGVLLGQLLQQAAE
jgi:uncharacterized protein YyaL (SSP411 family)